MCRRRRSLTRAPLLLPALPLLPCSGWTVCTSARSQGPAPQQQLDSAAPHPDSSKSPDGGLLVSSPTKRFRHPGDWRRCPIAAASNSRAQPVPVCRCDVTRCLTQLHLCTGAGRWPMLHSSWTWWSATVRATREPPHTHTQQCRTEEMSEPVLSAHRSSLWLRPRSIFSPAETV